jgi:hypothetical protein
MVIISYTNSCCIGSVRITLRNLGMEYELVMQNSDVGTSLWTCERRRFTYRADPSGRSLVFQLLLVLGMSPGPWCSILSTILHVPRLTFSRVPRHTAVLVVGWPTPGPPRSLAHDSNASIGIY